jgi:hypothetical protein
VTQETSLCPADGQAGGPLEDLDDGFAKTGFQDPREPPLASIAFYLDQFVEGGPVDAVDHEQRPPDLSYFAVFYA